MLSRKKALGGFLILATLVASSLARSQSGEMDVDVELVLAVDASRSMQSFEQRIQRDGYVAALRQKDVIRAIRDGAHGKVAITYVEWAGSTMQRVIVPWMVIESAETAEKFASLLAEPIPSTQSRTSISGAIDFGSSLFDGNGFKGLRRVIDVSGDGANNNGRPVLEAKEQAIAKGITINGLPLMTRGDFYSDWAIEDLDVYYTNCVIGGPGAFMIPVNSWDQFPEAVRRKLVLELAGDEGEIQKAAYRSPTAPPVLLAQNKQSYDCLSGERIWQRRMQDWEAR
ncbi:DUF1194 domain-containing protein [Phyllobacterium sp. YR531]|uniref:DUF1194 domain-containing protein n=1 Tax=Phyllobacterium sp. YR531 TaxID=1144343 RepID=UPI00026F7E40|nr:DUF1194 domain-containing protein [Phyllobacterium sp. YR531]EJN03988.1 Protein of unknown function (DUF1194) [Phyllobacterium sp. YR531]